MSRHARAAQFVRKVARELCSEECGSKVLLSSADALLEQAIHSLQPRGAVGETLKSDPQKYSELLQQIIVDIRPELYIKPAQTYDLDSLLQLVQEAQSFVTDAGFSKSILALVEGAENGAGSSENRDEWIASCRRVLGSRSNPPLALLWTYASLELEQVPGTTGGDEADRVLHVVSSALALMERLDSLTSDRCHAFTATAALAPVLAELFEAECMLASASDCESESWWKAVNALESASKQGCIATYRCVKVVECENVFTPENVDGLSLDLRGLTLAARGIKVVTKVEINRKGVAELFPLATGELKEKLKLEGRKMEACADVVSGEAFLMRLMVTILRQRINSSSTEILENAALYDEVKLLARQGTDLFVDFMIDSKLSLKPFLNEDEACLLKAGLFDVITEVSLQAAHRPDVFIKKLMLAQCEIDFYRSNGVRSKVAELESLLSVWKISNKFSEWLLSLDVEDHPPNKILKSSRNLAEWLTDPANEKSVVSILLNITSDMEALERLNQAFVCAAEGMKMIKSGKDEPSSKDEKNMHEQVDPAEANVESETPKAKKLKLVAVHESNKTPRTVHGETSRAKKRKLR